MDILWKIKSCFIKKFEPEYNGFELQNWETFGLSKKEVETSRDWLGTYLAVAFMMIVAGLLKYFRLQDNFTQDILRPECFVISTSGLLVISFLTDFNLRKLAVLVFIGLIIIFL